MPFQPFFSYRLFYLLSVCLIAAACLTFVGCGNMDSNGAKGSFNFTATSALGGEKITVTGGSFDVKFNLSQPAE